MKTIFFRFYLVILFCLYSMTSISSIQPEFDMCLRLFDYQQTQQPDHTPEAPWTVLNDNVMGGRSEGRFLIGNNSLIFSGFINTNGGGFASIRYAVPANSFSGVDRIRISIRSDGRPYTLSLADEFSKRRGLSHRTRIGAAASREFQEFDVIISDLQPMFRGRSVQAPELNMTKIHELGIMLNDTVDGNFRLEIAWIDLCR